MRESHLNEVKSEGEMKVKMGEGILKDTNMKVRNIVVIYSYQTDTDVFLPV